MEEVVDVANSKKHLIGLVKNTPVDLIILSTILPGDEDIVETVFNILKLKDVRFIILTKSLRESFLQDLFYLGVRDFVADPINPAQLLNLIHSPTSFKDAVKILKSPRPSFNLRRLFTKARPTQSEYELPFNAQHVLDGVFSFLDCEMEGKIEDNLFIIEQSLLNYHLND